MHWFLLVVSTIITLSRLSHMHKHANGRQFTSSWMPTSVPRTGFLNCERRWVESHQQHQSHCSGLARRGRAGRTMWTKKDIVRAGAAIIGTLVGWGLIRLLFPSLDYYPPESLTRVLEPSWFVSAGLRKLAMASFGLVALVVMAVLFNVVQQRWPGRGDFFLSGRRSGRIQCQASFR